VSRITVTRAVKDLQMAGLVERRAGSGTFVRQKESAALSFGLLIPDLGETEIFEPICQGMMGSPLAHDHALVWGNTSGLANTAGRIMHTLRRLEMHVPRNVRLVGIDDVEYASLLPVPLTTLRQPTRQIGDVALSLMLQRIARPDLPARDTRLRCELIVRESCGFRAAQPPAPHARR
jgi:hypothetical protein